MLQQDEKEDNKKTRICSATQVSNLRHSIPANNQTQKEKLPTSNIAPIYQYVRARLLNPHVGGFPSNNAEEKIYSKDLYIKAK